MCSSAYITTAHSRGVSTVEGEKHCPTFFHTDLAAALERREQGGREGASECRSAEHARGERAGPRCRYWADQLEHVTSNTLKKYVISSRAEGSFTRNAPFSLHFSLKSAMYEITKCKVVFIQLF